MGKSRKNLNGTAPPPGEVTALLARLREGDPAARERLFALTYDRMRQIARNLLRAERPDHTLQPTALVNETLMQLLHGQALTSANDRAHLFAVVTRAMRHVLIDHERKRLAEKRGGDLEKQPLEAGSKVEDRHDSFARVDVLDAIEALSRVHERASQVATLRYAAGLSPPEIAERLGVSLSAVESDWRFAKAWLRRALERGGP